MQIRQVNCDDSNLFIGNVTTNLMMLPISMQLESHSKVTSGFLFNCNCNFIEIFPVIYLFAISSCDDYIHSCLWERCIIFISLLVDLYHHCVIIT